MRIDRLDTITRISFRRWTAKVERHWNQQFLISSEDDQIRFEQEIAEISAERDAIEKARLELLDEHETLKAESVLC